jgi:hypothetical protein
MNKDLKQRGKLRTYKSELENSFGFVLSEAGQLYQGQGRLRKTYERLARRLDELVSPTAWLVVMPLFWMWCGALLRILTFYSLRRDYGCQKHEG